MRYVLYDNATQRPSDDIHAVRLSSEHVCESVCTVHSAVIVQTSRPHVSKHNTHRTPHEHPETSKRAHSSRDDDRRAYNTPAYALARTCHVRRLAGVCRL